MFGNSISSRLKSLDVYKNLPRELTEPTLAGALSKWYFKLLIVFSFYNKFDNNIIIIYFWMPIFSFIQNNNRNVCR